MVDPKEILEESPKAEVPVRGKRGKSEPSIPTAMTSEQNEANIKSERTQWKTNIVVNPLNPSRFASIEEGDQVYALFHDEDVLDKEDQDDIVVSEGDDEWISSELYPARVLERKEVRGLLLLS